MLFLLVVLLLLLIVCWHVLYLLIVWYGFVIPENLERIAGPLCFCPVAGPVTPSNALQLQPSHSSNMADFM